MQVGKIAGIAGLLVLLLVAAFRAGEQTNANRASQAVVRAAAESVTVAVQYAVNVERVAVRLLEEAAREREARLIAEARAAASERRRSAATAEFARVAETSPPDCAPAIRAAEVALEAAQDVITEQGAALSSAERESRLLRRSNDSLTVALIALHNAAGTIVSAVERQEASFRLSLWQRVSPKVGFGVAAGIDPQRRFNTVAGVTVGWTF